ncbi:MAG: hypothetical protein M3Y59_05370 [Myxococcota bacterium]|nr:hypothetical protein [Myxococcota bacterium]
MESGRELGAVPFHPVWLSRLLYFEQENHWVLKPQNSLRWHQEVLAWIARWTK